MKIWRVSILTGLLGFIGLIGFSLVGKWLVPLLPIVLPAPLIGMLALFIALLFIGHIPSALALAAKPLLGHMSLLFVPAILGVWHYQALIKANWLPLSLAVIITTVVALAFTGWLTEKIQGMVD